LKYIPSGNPAAVFAEKQLFKKTIPHRAISWKSFLRKLSRNIIKKKSSSFDIKTYHFLVPW
jgi:hypothetical protein